MLSWGQRIYTKAPHWLVISLLLMLFVNNAWSDADSSAVLERISWTETRDTVVLSLEFSGNLPEKYRVHPDQDTAGNRSLLLAFLGASIGHDPFQGAVPPTWVIIQPQAEGVAKQLRLLVMTNREVVYHSQWKGNAFQLVFPNVLWKENPFWKKPWLYMGLGAAVAGGTVLWLTTGKSTNSSQTIDPPNIDLPN